MIQGGDPMGTGTGGPGLPVRGRVPAGRAQVRPARAPRDGQRRSRHQREPVLRHRRADRLADRQAHDLRRGHRGLRRRRGDLSHSDTADRTGRRAMSSWSGSRSPSSTAHGRAAEGPGSGTGVGTAGPAPRSADHMRVDHERAGERSALRETFERDGFVLIEGALAADEVERLTAAVDRVYRAERGDEGGPLHLLAFCGRDAAFLEMIDHPATLPLVVDTLGPEHLHVPLPSRRPPTRAAGHRATVDVAPGRRRRQPRSRDDSAPAPVGQGRVLPHRRVRTRTRELRGRPGLSRAPTRSNGRGRR